MILYLFTSLDVYLFVAVVVLPLIEYNKIETMNGKILKCNGKYITSKEN